MAKQAGAIVKELKEAASGKKAAESDILEKVEKMCDPDQDDGDWIARYDIVEDGAALTLKDMGVVGKCNSECRTIARACEQLHEDLDLTDLSAMLVKGKQRSAVTNWMCYDATDACAKKPPQVPKDRPAGEAFVPMDPDELKTVKMLRNMKAQGLSGSMYSRDSLQEELAQMTEEHSDDPDFVKVLKDTGLDQHVPGGLPGDTGAAGANTQQRQEPDSGEGAGVTGAAAAAEGVKKLFSGLGDSKILKDIKNKIPGLGAKPVDLDKDVKSKGFSDWLKARMKGDKKGDKAGGENVEL